MKRMNPILLPNNQRGQAHVFLPFLFAVLIAAIITVAFSMNTSGTKSLPEDTALIISTVSAISPVSPSDSLAPTPEAAVQTQESVRQTLAAAIPTFDTTVPTPEATVMATAEPTAAPSPLPTMTQAPAPIDKPTPTVKPTATPTPTVKPTPTLAPTPTPTVKPTATPAPTPTVKPTPSPTPVIKEEWTPAEWRAELFRLTNIERTKAGVPVLQMGSNGLLQAAGIRAEEIAASFSHTRPDGSSCFTVLVDYQVTYHTAGENIAMATAGYRTPAQVMQMWMNSSGHRNNILSASFTALGIGYHCANGSEWFVQMFVG